MVWIEAGFLPNATAMLALTDNDAVNLTDNRAHRKRRVRAGSDLLYAIARELKFSPRLNAFSTWLR